MNTTNDKEEKVEWEKLGQEEKKPPEITKLIKLMIDNNNVKSMLVENGEYIIFDGNLLHGSGKNNEDYIRIVINFFIIPSNKPINYYSSKEANNKNIYYKKYTIIIIL